MQFLVVAVLFPAGTISHCQLFRTKPERHLYHYGGTFFEPSLTAEFDPDEVFDAQIFQEDPGGGRCFKKEGDVCVQLSVEGGKVKVRRLLVKKRSVPDVFCKYSQSSPFKNSAFTTLQFFTICLCCTDTCATRH